MKITSKMKKEVTNYGQDIICSKGYEKQKKYIQHGNISVFEHCFGVACLSIYIAKTLHIRTDKKSLIRGALLHDYFLYDWHKKDKSHRLHGFTHAKKALHNAKKDFKLCEKEQDIIKKHMFPLNLKPPRYRESAIVCIADKICAIFEILSIKY